MINTPDATSVRALKVDLRQAELQTARGDTASAAQYFTRALDRVLGLGESASAALPDTLFAYTQQLPSPEAARATIARIETLPMVKTLRTGGRLSADESVQLRTALGRLEQASGDLAAAQRDLDEALKLRMTHDEATSPWLAQVQGMIAECHAQAGNLPAARAALAQAQITLDKGNTKLPYFTKPLTRLRARLAKS